MTGHMPPLRALFRRLRPTPTEVRECRNCGTTLDGDEQMACPDCGGDEIATYRLTD